MIRLYLVGFTADLSDLIFARRRGAQSGTFKVAIDARIRRTLEEVGRLEEQKRQKEKDEKRAARDGQPPVRSSKLTPKEIQSLLRKGRSSQEIARLAETDVSWIDRFSTPVLAERAGVVDAVRAATVSKARLGPSAMPVGESIIANLRERRVSISPETLDEGWSARQRDGHWEVTFRYLSRGRRREASFAYDSGTRKVSTLNTHARDLGWRAAEQAPAKKTKKAARPASRRGKQRGRSGTR